jgi:hypothetical protein
MPIAWIRTCLMLVIPASILLPVPRASASICWQEEERQALIEALVEHAAWCGEQGLALERVLVLERVVHIDPEHAVARRALGFTRAKDGSWAAPANAHRPKDRGTPEAAAEAAQRLAGITAHYLDGLTTLILDEHASPESVRAAEDEILRVDPDHVLVHVRRGELLYEGRWVLRESVESHYVHRHIARRVSEAFEAAPQPELSIVEANDNPFGLVLHEAKNDELRVFASSGAAEAENLFRALCATRILFEQLFGRPVTFPRAGNVYALDSDAARDAFLGRHPKIDASQRAALARLDGTGIPFTYDWAWWRGDERARTDGLVRITLSAFLRESFDLGLEHAWLSEGLCLYLTGVLLGTRLTFFVQPESNVDPREAYAYREKLLEPGVDWLVEARRSLEKRGGPQLAKLFQKQATELTVDDLVYSHAVLAYLIEARGAESPLLLAALQEKRKVDEAWESTLGTPLADVTARLPRWLAECADLDGTTREQIDDATLLASWSKLDAKKRGAVISAFETALASLDNLLMRTLRERMAGSEDLPAGARSAEPPEYYDPKIHAPDLPIPRHWLASDDPLVTDAIRKMLPPVDPRALRSSWRYEWGTGDIVRVLDPANPETIFLNALHGIPPGVDFARDLALGALDRGDERKVFRALAHAYTDREGGVYPGLTLYEAWDSELVIEMPDVDVLGFVHEIWGDWTTWVSPIPGSEFERLYGKIKEEFVRVRTYRTLREALADALMIGEPSARYGFDGLRTNLHALWAESGSDPARLAQTLPGSEEREKFIADWIVRCRNDPALWRRGRVRELQLRADGDAVRDQLIAALRSTGALPAAATTKR